LYFEKRHKENENEAFCEIIREKASEREHTVVV
jgi:hypothetical protein